MFEGLSKLFSEFTAPLRWVLTVGLSVFVSACATYETRTIDSLAPDFNLENPAPAWAQEQALVIWVEAKVSGSTATGLLKAQIANSKDSQGRDWSDLFGNAFSIRIGDEVLKMQKTSTDALHQVYQSSPRAFDSDKIDEFTALYDADIRVETEDGTDISRNSVFVPRELKALSSNIPVLRLTNCVGGELRWENAGGIDPVYLSIGNLNQYSNGSPQSGGGILDSGSWLVPLEAFQKIFVEDLLLGSVTRTENVSITRVASTQSIRLKGTFERTMFVYAISTFSQPAEISYLNICP